MRDVTEELTAYFDATVERVTAEDVLAGSAVRVQNGRGEPVRAYRLRPAWVATAGFAVTIALIGGAVGVVRLLSGDSTIEVGTGAQPVGDGGDRLSGSWGFLIAAGILLALAVTVLARRGRTNHLKERDMQTLERPEVAVSPRPISPSILVLLAALLVLISGAVGWWIGSSGEEGAAADTPEIVSLFNQAMLDGDAEAMAALHTETGVWEERDLERPVLSRQEQYTGSTDIAEHLRSGALAADTEAMTVNKVMLLDNVTVYEWTASGTSNSLPFETTGVLVFEMQGDLIAKSYLFYDSAEWFNLP